MAQLQLQNGNILTNYEDIVRTLSPLKIELSKWPVEEVTQKSPQALDLLGQDTLSPEQKENLLQCFDSRFEQQKAKFGYQTRDLVVLHPEVPGLDDMLAKFDKTHRHTDDEVRYIVDGAGIFGFVMADQQVLLTVEAGEYIRVPAETEHWFILDPNRRIKAIRYFSDMAGWVAHYTGSEIHPNLKVQA